MVITLSKCFYDLSFSIKASEQAETTIYACRALEPVDKRQCLKLVQSAIRLNPVNHEARQLLTNIIVY